MDAYIITIGDELLIGQVTDTNSAYMATELALIGVKIKGIITCADTKEGILESLEYAYSKVDLVFTTGGLGPTKDDISKKVLSDYFGTKLEFHQPTYDRIVKIFTRFGRPITESHRIQSFMPESAEVLTNKMGTAPGMWFKKDGKQLFSMPGVPYEMKYLMENEIIPCLTTQITDDFIIHKTLLTVGTGETVLAGHLEEIEENLPEGFTISYLPNIGQVRVRLSGRGKEESIIKKEFERLFVNIEKAIEIYVYGYDKDNLQSALGRQLFDAQSTVSTAESCTGGYISHLITSIPGSSAYYTGSIIAYSNQVKIDNLGVSQEILESKGAVSEETVIQMANGVRKELNTTYGIAVSGIAGPGGGSEEKPVGTIWIAVSSKEKTETLKLSLGKDRMRNIQYTSIAALNMLRKSMKTES